MVEGGDDCGSIYGEGRDLEAAVCLLGCRQDAAKMAGQDGAAPKSQMSVVGSVTRDAPIMDSLTPTLHDC